jgi:hypothetical protein
LFDILGSFTDELAYPPIDAREAEFGKCAKTPLGRPYQNLRIGCDTFHERVLDPVPESA